MKLFLYGWVLPVGLVWAWLLLSAYDMNFGFYFLSRDAHDLVFAIYGYMLDMSVEQVQALMLKGFLIDTALVGAFVAFRKRKAIKAYFQRSTLTTGSRTYLADLQERR